jgi:hypothetical protein
MARRDDGTGTRQARQRIAQEAARLLAEHGGDDLAWARRKAAARFGIREEAALPGSEEILAALRSHRELFGRPDAAAGSSLRRLREAALEAMEFFAALEPRLVGAVLTGDIDGEAPVRLHLHADDPDAVEHRLLDRRIPARQKTRRLRLDDQRGSDVPAWAFEADGIAFELLQLPLSSLRQPPRDELDERPMQRASIAAVRRLLGDLPEDPGD